MILFFFVLNLAISIFNAWGCGRTWDSTKAKGGGAHFMNWMGAIMASAGFTWCYLVLIGFICASIEVQHGHGAAGPILNPKALHAFADLGYLIIIFPVLGSGLAITVSSWRAFAQRRSLGNGVIAGWNTYAQLSNTYDAVREIPGVWSRLGDFFGSKDGDSEDSIRGLVVVLVAVAALAGVITTYGIVQAARRRVALAWPPRPPLVRDGAATASRRLRLWACDTNKVPF